MLFNHNKILLIDDTPATLDILFYYLADKGLEVFVATGGQEGILEAERTNPEIILLDVMMPDVDGFETCRRLKENPRTKDIPVIFMTALSTTSDKVKAFELGAVDYVTKPLQYKEVLARISTHLTLKKLQGDLQESVNKLEVQNEALDTFARTVAHNLKNPLGAIINSAEFLDEFARLPKDMQPYLQNIIETSQRMSTTTDALLLLAHVRKQDVCLEPINMAEVFIRSQNKLQHLLDTYQATIACPTTWPAALGYGPWVEEVWANYLSNAIKYGGRPPQILVGTTPQSNGHIQFWVQDNGTGLNPEEQDKLFTEFMRLKQDEIEGNGLGLAIVQRIVKKMGGYVGVESQFGQGSKFYFTLPDVK
ncbi:MAG: hybrid sensor histidine kinase/response regulator [Anaerolineae bacterium]|nr:hybrid sensor histidine kinase/response regulator [Anaerolineae bacterium]